MQAIHRVQGAANWPGRQVVGTLCVANTDLGNPVQVWRPNPGTAPDDCYWCHGHSTLSHHLLGYSIPGGSMPRVLEDEWEHITKKPELGDIVVFKSRNGDIMHTARIERAVQRWGRSTEKTLSSKNGGLALLRGQTIDQVQRAYNRTTWRVPDPGSCCCCCPATIKQYYRRRNRQIDPQHHFL